MTTKTDYEAMIKERDSIGDLRQVAAHLNRDGMPDSPTPAEKRALMDKVSAKIAALEGAKGTLGHAMRLASERSQVEAGEGDVQIIPAQALAPVISPETMREEMRRWDELTAAIIDKEKDVLYIAFGGKDSPKKPYLLTTFWNKVRRAYNINIQILAQELDSVVGFARYTVRATAPNGSFYEATASCDRKEPRGADKMTFDNLCAKAMARAKNRAIRGLIGFGEPSAEEIEGESE